MGEGLESWDDIIIHDVIHFLQGDFGKCGRLGEVTLSLLTHGNWQWSRWNEQQVTVAEWLMSDLAAN